MVDAGTVTAIRYIESNMKETSGRSGKVRQVLARGAAGAVAGVTAACNGMRALSFQRLKDEGLRGTVLRVLARGAAGAVAGVAAIGSKARSFSIRELKDKDLWLIGVLTVLLAVAVAVSPAGISRIMLGLPFLLFFPGYTLVAALFHKKGSLGGVERVALSFGLSIAVVPLIGLVLNFTPWGIRLDPILISVAVFVIAASGVAAYRRGGLAPEERFSVSFSLRLPSWQGQSRVDKALSIVLAVAILGAIVTLAYVLATPRIGERFTEFYVLGPGGKAENYPTALRVGEEGQVIVGVVNREHESADYRVEIWIDGERAKLRILGEDRDDVSFELEHERKWERVIGFVPQEAGTQKVEFVLYRDGDLYFESPLHLWVDVEEP